MPGPERRDDVRERQVRLRDDRRGELADLDLQAQHGVLRLGLRRRHVLDGPDRLAVERGAELPGPLLLLPEAERAFLQKRRQASRRAAEKLLGEHGLLLAAVHLRQAVDDGVERAGQPVLGVQRVLGVAGGDPEVPERALRALRSVRGLT
jgi:hypothetical protein